MDQISCPNCNLLVDPNMKVCPHCGVNLALAAILAEKEIAISSHDLANVPISPELLIPRLGDYLIKKGLITPAMLEKALTYQKERLSAGIPVLLGEALVEMGLLNQRTLDQVITEQIFQLQAALRRANQELEARVIERTADLQQALNRLSELNQLKSNFVSNISHELRTPLTHIKGYLDLLLGKELGELQEEQLKALAIMKKAEQRLERLINDLIKFAVASKGEFNLKLTVIDVEEMIDCVIRQAEPGAREKRIQIVRRCHKTPMHVRGDREKLGWVLMQLLDNAIKFSPAASNVEIGAQLEGVLVRIYVQDHGIGIPREKMSTIFEAFRQGDGSSTRKYGGTGLGLALVKRIVEAHGTVIRVASEVGRGSSFEFRLPLVAEVRSETRYQMSK